MRSLRTIAFITSLFAGPVLFAQAPAPDWRFAHPGVTLVGGFRLKAMLDSPLVNTLIAQATAKDPSTGAMIGMMRGALGGVSEVHFSVRDMGKGKNPDVLALVTGVLDEAAAVAMTQGKTSVRRIDANTLLLGEGESLEDAVARLSKPAVALQSRALDHSKALANNDLWIAGSLPALPMTIPLLDSLRGLALGISAQSDLRIEIALETASPKIAEDLVSSARRSQVQQPGLGAALQTEVDGATAHFRFVMEGDQVIQAVQQAIANGDKSPLAGLLGQSPALSEPTASSKPKRDTVIVYGLEGGPREFKTTGKP
ncbi:MAG: hypothetical protein JWO19_274 [Bryobacterales bacterium]|jgi:hypothetical protein|nr:hypothetical protein [Bryobacterales bacterium]